MDLFQLSIESADHLLEAAGGSVKKAIVMQKFGCSRDEAEQKLADAHGFIARIQA